MLSDSIKKIIVRWGPAILMMSLIFLFSSIPMRLSPSRAEHLKLNWETLFRKCGHMLEYALLAIALLSGFKIKNWKGIVVILGCVLLYALSDEFHQSFVLGRTARLIDVIIDMFGGTLGIWFAMKYLEELHYS
jgi:VanZ family protein